MSKRLIAVLGILIIVLSAVFTGCGQKVTIENDTSTTDDGKIRLDGNYEDIPAGAQIVVDSNGQSYLVDGEGNSVVYDALTPYVIPNVPGSTVTIPNPTVTIPSKTTTTTTTTKTTTTTTTTSQKDAVVAALNAHRTKSGSDEELSKALNGENIQSLNVSFGENSIELHKGTYGSTTVGCEVGLYKSGALMTGNDIAITGATLYNSGKTIDGTNEKKPSYWNNIYNGKQSDMVLKTTVKLNEDDMNAFCDALEDKGFNYGEASNYRNRNNYAVDIEGDECFVTVIW